MRVRVTLMTSNDVPITNLSEDREEAIDMITNAWSIFLFLLSLKGGAHNSDGYVERVEILEEAEGSET